MKANREFVLDLKFLITRRYAIVVLNWLLNTQGNSYLKK